MTILRPAFLSDAQPLATLGRDSFCAAFAHLYDPADLDTFLKQVYAPEVVAKEIADDFCIHQLAAVSDKPDAKLLGFCKMRDPSWYADDSNAANPIALGQLYTDPAATGQGIGAGLMDWALDLARSRGHDAIQLSVWSENTRAQKFYQRYGFAKIKDIEFWVGNTCDAEFLYELRL
ncbi:hypothetical protein HME9302_01979 [Alteripontixanthobacter maritimus]|uniref:N-acetyltransferase domain-containing protein n=1 Tax=Alteripontixanthobacter maritimus TaxID=2161824 RepID=A0A369Q7B9_9SPHN|nr:N-acetyltransferase [Alteripontixanthobacter maritimus]RDC60763.1 hypothetical protein HME9302_01979 [Alteripontixanthobacter maritimus]